MDMTSRLLGGNPVVGVGSATGWTTGTGTISMMPMPKIVLYPADVSGCGLSRLIWPGYVATQNGADVRIHWPDHKDHIWAESRYSVLDDKYHVAKVYNKPEADVLVFQRPS